MSKDPGSKIYERGLQLAEDGRHEEAIDCIREHLRGAPSDFQALNDVGVILFCMGRNDEAIEYFERARSHCDESESTELNWNLCEAYLSNAQPSFAIRLFGEMGRQEALSADLLNRTAREFLAEGSNGNAIEMLLHSLVLSPEQDILRPMIDVIKSKRPKVALLGGSGSDYADELFSFLDERFTAELLVGKGRAEAQPVIDWCDIAFFAGYSETLSEISFANRTCRIVAMLSEADVDEPRLANVHWDNVDTVIVLGGEGAKESLSDRLANLKNRTNVVSVLKGADTVRFKFAERVRGKRIACLGGLDVKSNPMLLLQCMQKLHYLDNDYRLYFAGEFADGATEDYVRYMADEMGLSNVVFFDGAIKDEAKWLRDKHYIAGASITGGGFGGILKGMSCGLRPVVHNFPGARDMLDSEFVFDLAEDFCEQILSGSYEPVRYRRIVEEGYSQQSQMEAINDVLFRLERELSRASGSVAASEGQDQYGWGPVGFDGSNRATREVESVAGGASDITFGRGTKEVSSKVIPIKPLDVSEYDLKVGRGEATGVAQSSEKANGIGSINEMSADVLRDWRAFSERMNGQPGSSEALDDVNAMADVSPSGVTPLDLSSRKSANGSNITELPTVGVSPGEKAEVSGVPFT